MSAAKHRSKIQDRERDSFVAYCRRQEKHEELLAQHKSYKRSKNKPLPADTGGETSNLA